METVILRPVHILGEVRNAPSNYLRLRQPWRVAGYDPMLQVVHEADVAQAICLAMQPNVKGIFNIDGCTPCTLSRLLELAECEPRSAPMTLLRPVLERMWKMRLTSFPSPELDHLRFVCMVEGARARDTLGYKPKHDLIQTMAHLRLTRLLYDV